jgi:hypothetical protein
VWQRQPAGVTTVVRIRGLSVPDIEEDFTADPVELSFDLAFVFAFSQIVGLLLAEPREAACSPSRSRSSSWRRWR